VRRAILILCAVALAAWAAPAAALGDGWSMWRADAARSGATSETLGPELHVQWVRHLPPQVTAWKDEGGMKFDRAYQPVALGDMLFVGSTVSDRVTAYRLDTGEEAWRFYTEGPVRLAPAAWKDRVFVASDDGYLYALGAADGRLLWKVRGGPSDRRLVGNERVISTWPARGGPVVADDTVYFAAGVWPFMGTFVHALDAGTGRVVWANDSTSFTWRLRPHPGAASFSGLSPQGHLAAVGDRLIVPGSASSPGVFDRSTGEFLFYAPGTGPAVSAQGALAFTGNAMFGVERGLSARIENAGRIGRPVLGRDAWYVSGGALDAAHLKLREAASEEGGPVLVGSAGKLWSEKVDPLLAAGSRLVARAKGGVRVLDVSAGGAKPKPVWEGKVEGSVTGALVSGGRLVVVTAEGSLTCFGPKATKARTFALPKLSPPKPNVWTERAREIVSAVGASEGYALVWGLKDGGLVEALPAAGGLHVVAVDADAKKIDALRRRLDDAGLYGSRAAAMVAEPAEAVFAPYLATLVTSEDPKAAGLAAGKAFVSRLFDPLRPYGGAAALPLGPDEGSRLAAWVGEAGLEGAEVSRSGGLTILKRAGPLPGSADWRGQNADAGNTRCSRDERVKAPLGVLWFGNSLSNSLVLPRHGEGPVEQVAGGRMFIEGPESLSASDVYTGRLLWTRRFEGLGKYYDILNHQRGAHAIGGNFYAVPDAVYVAAGQTVHLLDPSTGRTAKEFRLPGGSLFLLVYEDLLVAGAYPIVVEENGRYNLPASSEELVVMDRHRGKVLWTREAAGNFQHYAIVAGRGKVFCIDRLGPEQVAALKRRGRKPDETPRLYALDARTGKVVWQTDRYVGESLSYAEPQDILVARAALRGADGSVVWDTLKTSGYQKDENPGLDSSADPLWWGKWGLMIRGGDIVTQGHRMFDLATGVQRVWRTVGGDEMEWRYRRFHGCGPSACSLHLVTFRSGCAGFFDLARDGGTGNLGGFRSGCTSNLIVGDGVLSAPDYTRTCTCAYQNRSSLGLVHMPEVEYWTFGAHAEPGRAGFNFGAPGDRRDDSGTLWWDVPVVGGPSPEVPVTVRPEGATYFVHHSSRLVGGEGAVWIAASGVVGAREVAVDLAQVGPPQPAWTVRLHFAEPEEVGAGRRVFSVALQGKTVLDGFDVAKEAGGVRRGVVREFKGVAGGGSLCITLTPASGSLPTLLCGVEVVAEP